MGISENWRVETRVVRPSGRTPGEVRKLGGLSHRVGVVGAVDAVWLRLAVGVVVVFVFGGRSVVRIAVTVDAVALDELFGVVCEVGGECA